MTETQSKKSNRRSAAGGDPQPTKHREKVSHSCAVITKQIRGGCAKEHLVLDPAVVLLLQTVIENKIGGQKKSTQQSSKYVHVRKTANSYIQPWFRSNAEAVYTAHSYLFLGLFGIMEADNPLFDRDAD